MKYRLWAVVCGPALVMQGLSQRASGTVVASDTADNYTVYSNFAGANQGSGFGVWSSSITGDGGQYVNAAGNSYDTAGLPGQTFDIWQNGSGTLNSGITTDTRPFNASLTAGETFSFVDTLHYANGLSEGNPTSLLGFSLLDSSSSSIFTFDVAGGGAGYEVTDKTQTGVVTSVPYNYETAYTFAFTLLDASGDYSLTAFQTSNPTNSTTLTGQIDTSVSAPASVAFFNNDGGFSSDMQVSDLQIVVPEPASLSLVAAGGLGLLVRRRRRR